MATYITVSIELSSLSPWAVNHHVTHADGESTWRVDGAHNPVYLRGRIEDLRRFRDSLNAAIEENENKALLAEATLKETK